MIRCNLSVILAERSIKISKVAHDTGLSRTTVTSLAMNYAQGIQFDTLNKLCMYLKITPDELISYVPFDVTVKRVSFESKWNCGLISEEVPIKIWFEVSDKGYSDVDYLDADLTIKRDLEHIDLNIVIWNTEPTDDADKTKYDRFTRVFKKLPRPFLSDIEEGIMGIIIEALIDNTKELSGSIDWDEIC